MKDYFLFAGGDEILVAERFSHRVLAGVVLPHRMLPDGEAQKIKARLSILPMQCVTDAGLARFQFQPHALKPLLDKIVALVNDLKIPVADDEVICITDNCW